MRRLYSPENISSNPVFPAGELVQVNKKMNMRANFAERDLLAADMLDDRKMVAGTEVVVVGYGAARRQKRNWLCCKHYIRGEDITAFGNLYQCTGGAGSRITGDH